MDISFVFSWTSPPGFHEAAVASSATAINAPNPNALAPDPTGLGENAKLILPLVVIAFEASAKSGVETINPQTRESKRIT
jgi:hypothetical protein